MDRATKKVWVGEMNERFSGAEIVLVAHNKGMTVAEMTDLRVRIRQTGAGMKIAKNRLTKIALKDTRYAPLENLFKGPVAVAWSKDPVSAAKVISEFAKQNEKLVILGGAFGDKILQLAEIQALAKLPSLDELRAKIIALLQTPATRIAAVLQAPAGQLARVVGAYAKKEA